MIIIYQLDNNHDYNHRHHNFDYKHYNHPHHHLERLYHREITTIMYPKSIPRREHNVFRKMEEECQAFPL